jgi:hypothetical protein
MIDAEAKRSSSLIGHNVPQTKRVLPVTGLKHATIATWSQATVTRRMRYNLICKHHS